MSAGVEHRVRGIEGVARRDDALGVGSALGPQAVTDKLLHRGRDVLVVEAIPKARLQRLCAIGRDELGAVGGDVVEVLDNRR